jgi:hypothetical protein
VIGNKFLLFSVLVNRRIDVERRRKDRSSHGNVVFKDTVLLIGEGDAVFSVAATNKPFRYAFKYPA